MRAERPIGSLAVEVTRGTSNNLFQVATLVRAATTIDATVDVLFRGDALRKLARSRIDTDEWSEAYEAVHDELLHRLHAAEFCDMTTFLRDAKEHGDHVSYWACAEDLDTSALQLVDLAPIVDGTRSADAFLRDADSADALLRF